MTLPTTPEELDALIRDEMRRDGGNPIGLLLSIQDDLDELYLAQVAEWRERADASLEWTPPPEPLRVSARLTFEILALVEARVAAVESRIDDGR